MKPSSYFLLLTSAPRIGFKACHLCQNLPPFVSALFIVFYFPYIVTKRSFLCFKNVYHVVAFFLTFPNFLDILSLSSSRVPLSSMWSSYVFFPVLCCLSDHRHSSHFNTSFFLVNHFLWPKIPPLPHLRENCIHLHRTQTLLDTLPLSITLPMSLFLCPYFPINFHCSITRTTLLSSSFLLPYVFFACILPSPHTRPSPIRPTPSLISLSHLHRCCYALFSYIYFITLITTSLALPHFPLGWFGSTCLSILYD